LANQKPSEHYAAAAGTISFRVSMEVVKAIGARADVHGAATALVRNSDSAGVEDMAA